MSWSNISNIAWVIWIFTWLLELYYFRPRSWRKWRQETIEMAVQAMKQTKIRQGYYRQDHTKQGLDA